MSKQGSRNPAIWLIRLRTSMRNLMLPHWQRLRSVWQVHAESFPRAKDRVDLIVRRSAIRMALCIAILGLTVDASKALFWSDWRPVQRFGLLVFPFYIMSNMFGFLLTAVTLHRGEDWYAMYFWYALAIAGVGILDIAPEVGLMPIVWHGAMGFIAALTIAAFRFFADLESRWQSIGQVMGRESSFDVKKEFMKEGQWGLTTLVQVMVALTAIFGVSMTILFRDGRINQWDLKATAIQMAIGFGSCLTIAYWWAVAPALRIMHNMRSTWS